MHGNTGREQTRVRVSVKEREREREEEGEIEMERKEPAWLFSVAFLYACVFSYDCKTRCLSGNTVGTQRGSYG